MTLTFWLMLAMFCTPVRADQEIIIAVDTGNPPFMYAVGNKALGLYPFIARHIFAAIHTPVKIMPLPWQRAINEADKGMIGIAGIYKTPERLRKYDYSLPIYEEHVFIYTRTDNRISFRSLNDLKNKKIGVLRGWSYGEQFDQLKREGFFSVKESSSDKQNFQLLQLKRIDMLLAIGDSGRIYLQSQAKKATIKKLEPALLDNYTYIIFPKQNHRTELIEKFNDQLQHMKQSGEYQALIQNYFYQIVPLVKR